MNTSSDRVSTPDKISSRRPTARLAGASSLRRASKTVLRLLEECKSRIKCWASATPKSRSRSARGCSASHLGPATGSRVGGKRQLEHRPGVFIAAPLQIYYGPWMTFRPGGRSDARSICYVHFALAVAGQWIPDWVEHGAHQFSI
jgi:hypothetical protein